MRRTLIVLAVGAGVGSLSACKGDDGPAGAAAKPTTAPPTAIVAAPELVEDAPEPAGAAARRIAPEVPEAAVERGRAALAGLRAGLLEALTAALADGPAKAIDACAVEAPRIAAARAGEPGVRALGRMSRRARNPAHAVAGWQEEALGHFEALVAAGGALDGAAFARALDDGRVGYAEPLVVGGLCLACHGAALTPDVTAAVAARYPDDRATGYEVGDLRGVAWVELAAPP